MYATWASNRKQQQYINLINQFTCSPVDAFIRPLQLNYMYTLIRQLIQALTDQDILYFLTCTCNPTVNIFLCVNTKHIKVP